MYLLVKPNPLPRRPLQPRSFWNPVQVRLIPPFFQYYPSVLIPSQNPTLPDMAHSPKFRYYPKISFPLESPTQPGLSRNMHSSVPPPNPTPLILSLIGDRVSFKNLHKWSSPSHNHCKIQYECEEYRRLKQVMKSASNSGMCEVLFSYVKKSFNCSIDHSHHRSDK